MNDRATALRTRFDEVLRREFPSLVDIEDGSYFVDLGVLDSFDFVRLTEVIEREFTLKIEDADMTEANFGSKAGILAYLEARAGSG